MRFDKQSFLAGLHTGLRLGRDPIGRNPPAPSGRYIWTEEGKKIITEVEAIPTIFSFDVNVWYPAAKWTRDDSRWNKEEGYQFRISRTDGASELKYTWYASTVPDEPPYENPVPSSWKWMFFSKDLSDLDDSAIYSIRALNPSGGNALSITSNLRFFKPNSYPTPSEQGDYYAQFIDPSLHFDVPYIFPVGINAISYEYPAVYQALIDASPEPFITE